MRVGFGEGKKQVRGTFSSGLRARKNWLGKECVNTRQKYLSLGLPVRNMGLSVAAAWAVAVRR